MTSKYLRELAMKAFNAFWCDRVPGLPPTAGYPTDAKRFYHDIATTPGATGYWRNSRLAQTLIAGRCRCGQVGLD